ncbi:MAG: ribosome biogenesis protein [Thaumarchaeota archaeon]|nr:MAG: ribosome biogenesis protein [Nitrososphaerota archaeon]
MPTLLNKCVKCGRYTLRRDSCPLCGSPVRSAHPPSISLKHRYIDLIVKTRRRDARSSAASEE